MLPAPARLRRRGDFVAVLRRGRRAVSGRLEVRMLLDSVAREASPRVGFVVTRASGGAVVRNRLVRRLRHLMRDRLSQLPAGSRVVVRVVPPPRVDHARSLDSGAESMTQDLDLALSRLLASRR